jgi:hypothetical protein
MIWRGVAGGQEIPSAQFSLSRRSTLKLPASFVFAPNLPAKSIVSVYAAVHFSGRAGEASSSASLG